jgi:transitional endoplasmic reticulum ATPase
MSKVEEYDMGDGKHTLVMSRTQEEVAQESVLNLLAEVGGGKVNDDDLTFEGRKFIIPVTMDAQGAIGFLERHIERNETETSFTKTYNYRFNDGCHALDVAIREIFGTAGIGKATFSFFGKNPPEMREIKTGLTTTVQVPVGQMDVPMIEGTVTTTMDRHPELGMLFKIDVLTKRKYRSHVEGLFRVVGEVLEGSSIYKGKAIDGQDNPEFLDVESLDPSKIIFSDEVMTQLNANVWSLLDHTEDMQREGLPLKRAVLLEGPYGTGKSSAGWITAQKALQNGWSFIMCRPGKDSLSEVMQTARLYQPAVVFFEDIDTLAQSGDRDDVTRLLDLFDGISSKGTQLMAVMTTNNVDKIHRGMLRPGRLDSVIHIGALDQNGIERLVRSVVDPALLDDEVNWAAVAEANNHYLPAYIKEGVDRAIRYSIINESERIGTDELVASAEGLRTQWSLQQEAGEGDKMPDLDRAIREAVADVVDGAEFHNRDGNRTTGDFADHIAARETENGYGASRV